MTKLYAKTANKIRRTLIKRAPEQFLFTSEGYAIHLDNRTGAVRMFNAETGEFIPSGLY